MRPWVILAVVWSLSALYAWSHLDRGWIPHDEGLLSQSAERVLRGELPHRDFDEVYTGGLSYLNALGFRIFGATLWSMRLVLFGMFLAWVPALFYIATRSASAAAAAPVVGLAVAWSLPAYPAPIPSWYNLFFATFGLAALFRYLETDHRRWIVAAGVAGGLSFLVKIVGLYFVAAVGLTFVYREQCLSRGVSGGERGGGRSYSLLVAAAMLGVVAAAAVLLRAHTHLEWSSSLLLPLAALAALVSVEERFQAAPALRRAKTLLGLAATFAGGVLIPVVPFLAFYAAADSIEALAAGLFVAPAKRLTFAAHPPPPFWTLVWGLPPLVLLGLVPLVRLRRREAVAATLALGGIIAVAYAADDYWDIWLSARSLAPLVAAAGAWFLARNRALGVIERQRLFALLSGAALCSLVQFPFSTSIYFVYVAPLWVLTAHALASCQQRRQWLTPWAVLAFYFVFAVVQVSSYFLRERQPPLLALERGGIRVSRVEKEEYERAVALLREHGAGEYVYATPDCPEIYFLAGKRNPTRTVFDFFDQEDERIDRVLAAVASRGVTAVVLNRSPRFSGSVPPKLESELAQRFPHSATVGRFLIRWRP